jgi:hypothetical protein
VEMPTQRKPWLLVQVRMMYLVGMNCFLALHIPPTHSNAANHCIFFCQIGPKTPSRGGLALPILFRAEMCPWKAHCSLAKLQRPVSCRSWWCRTIGGSHAALYTFMGCSQAPQIILSQPREFCFVLGRA